MNGTERIVQLAARARLEAPPRVEVVGDVMAALADRPLGSGERVGPLVWVAGFSAALALPVALAALMVWQAWAHPLLAALIDFPSGMGLQ